MINGVNVWHVIMLTCGLFNFFYILYTFLKKEDSFDGLDNCLFSVIMMLFGAATSVLGTWIIAMWELTIFINNAPKREYSRKNKLRLLIDDFNDIVKKNKYE
ncbi:hypothetical protein J5751_04385 [bacterium]|nr:hypothetical protein [bacterium]